MKISSELKIGVIGIVSLVVLIWGINYLKGRNILKTTHELHAFFADAMGLESSAPVVLNGVRVGYVDEILLVAGRELPVEVVMQIEKSHPLPEGSSAVLFSSDLLGTKAIRIDPGDRAGPVEDHDTLPSAVELDLVATLQAQLIPTFQRIGDLAVSLDALAVKLDTLASEEATRSTIRYLSEASASLNRMLADGGAVDRILGNMDSFTTMLKDQEDELAAFTGHLGSISETLDSAGIGDLAVELRAASIQLNRIIGQVSSGKGSAGKFIYSDSLYLNLNSLAADLDRLVKDLNENPQDYVHISLFGKSQRKER